MNIAVVSNSARASGGSLTYETAILEALERDPDVGSKLSYWHTNVGGGIRNHSKLLSPTGSIRRGVPWRRRPLGPDNLLTQGGTSLVYFLSPNWLMEKLQAIPFVCTVWDTGHRDLPEFPEFRGREWHARERLYSTSLPRAFHLVTDSERTGEKIAQLYGVDSRRWTSIGLPLPDQPNPSRDLPPGLALTAEDKFFIYPANKWPHKNHLTLIRAMVSLLEVHPGVKLVFTGEDRGMGENIQREIHRYRLAHAILDVGFVDEATYQTLLSKATALLMPTLLGPTNIPPLEAAQLGIPAIISDRHHFDPPISDWFLRIPAENPEAWFQHMMEVIESPPESVMLRTDGDVVTEKINAVLNRFTATKGLMPQ